MTPPPLRALPPPLRAPAPLARFRPLRALPPPLRAHGCDIQPVIGGWLSQRAGRAARGWCGLCGAWFPGEEADSEQQPADAPGDHDQQVRPAERGAEEPGLHAEREVPDREDAGDPQDPGRRAVAERDE